MALSKEQIIELLLSNRRKLTAYARSIVYDFHDAEDIYQNTSLKVIKSDVDFKDSLHLVKWLWTVCRNESIRKLKEQKKIPVALDENVLEAIQQEFQKCNHLDKLEFYSLLERCLDKLSSFAKQLIMLRYRNNLKGEKLANALDRKVSSVYVALSRTHRSIQICMKQQIDSMEK